MRRVTAWVALATAAAVGVLTGCADGDVAAVGGAEPVSAVSRPSAAEPVRPKSGAGSTPRPAAGTRVATDWGSVTYFGQRRPAAPNAPAPQQSHAEWVAIDVQTCLNSAQPGGMLLNIAWTVSDAGNGRTEPSSTVYQQFPTPEYPTQSYIEADSCVRGWIVYPILVGRALTSVRYSRDATAPPLATWAA